MRVLDQYPRVNEEMLNIKNLLEHVITKALNTRVYNYFL